MKIREKGFALVLVLILVAFGSMILTPTLNFAFSSLRSKQVVTITLKDQYARDGCAELAMWKLLYGGAAALLDEEGDQTIYECELNEIPADVSLTMQAKLGDTSVGGAEDNKVRLSQTVECDEDGSGDYGDDCTTLPEDVVGMLAKYTIFLDQVSPDTSVPMVAVYDQLPAKFDWNPSANPVTSEDGSFPEIVGLTPTNIDTAQNQIWKWDFSSSPLSFTQGQVRQFTFIATIEEAKGEYCNRAFLKMQSTPHESSGPHEEIRVLGASEEGCANGGTLVNKYIDQRVALPGVTTIFTYIINVENIEKNSQQIDLLKDVLPHDGFLFCNGTSQGDPLKTCDPPMYKSVADSFDPLTDSFTDTTGYTTMADPAETHIPADDRWELVWDAGWSMQQAGKAEDTFIMRFQAEISPTLSGSYYNEIFVDVDCSVPSVLSSSPDDVTTQADYCASYSWPSGGTIVPTYDVGSQTDRSLGQGNITVDWGTVDGTLQSWHVN